MDVSKSIKKRKITDKSVPAAILQNPDFGQDSKMYQDLLEMERKLDWNMMRKKVEVQDALSRTPTTTRTLRIFLSHTVSGQLWQSGSDVAPQANFETGEGIPAWSFKVEGRLLELPSQRSRDKAPLRKFSTMIKRIWPRAPGSHNPGDSPTRIRVIMYLEHFPEQYKLLPELASVLGIKEESRVGVVQALWNYIKLHSLQEKADRRVIKADEKLLPIFGAESVYFQNLPEIVNRFLSAPEPIVLHYTLNPTVPPPERPSAWDAEIKMEDTTLKNKMAVVVNPSKENVESLTKLDEEISLLAQSLHNSYIKRTFLESFSRDPAKFIQTWLESQSRDLETVLGSGPTEGMTVRQEDLRRSEFFRLPWAVAIQEGVRLASKGMQ
ncbi:SWI/SNF complex 60 kDa subunit [Amanita rubescens]|nr:SWI/SNF complex 60 kDa subunit [Amanita rubescens]